MQRSNNYYLMTVLSVTVTGGGNRGKNFFQSLIFLCILDDSPGYAHSMFLQFYSITIQYCHMNKFI